MLSVLTFSFCTERIHDISGFFSLYTTSSDANLDIFIYRISEYFSNNKNCYVSAKDRWSDTSTNKNGAGIYVFELNHNQLIIAALYDVSGCIDNVIFS